MTVFVPGYSTLTGAPETILHLLTTARIIDPPEAGTAESHLRTMAQQKKIIIKEETK